MEIYLDNAFGKVLFLIMENTLLLSFIIDERYLITIPLVFQTLLVTKFKVC